MIENLTDAIEKYNDFIESENATARALRANNDNSARFYEETAENDKKIVAWLTELQERRKAGWISVKDKLPDKNGKCLVFTDYGDVTMDSFVDGMFVCNLGNVTHWRPLPKAPESEASK